MTRSNRSHVSALLGLFAGALALLAAMGPGGAAPPAPAAPVADATLPVDPAFVGRVHECVDQASTFLLREYMPAADKTKDRFSGRRDKLSMSLSLWALHEVGVQYAKDPALQRGYAWLISQPLETPLGAPVDTSPLPIISNSTRVLALGVVKDRPPELQKCLEQDVHWLLETGLKPEGYSYGYQPKSHRNAIEFSYWAIRALDAADKQGVAVPATFWPEMLKVTWDNRAPTGGWQPYRGVSELHPSEPLQPAEALGQITPGNPLYNVTFPTTVAGICSMKMCLAHLSPAALASPDGRAMSQGLQEQIHWLDSRTQFPTVPFKHPISPVYVWWTCCEIGCSTYIDRPNGPDGGSLTNYGAVCWPAMVEQLRQITGQKSWGKVDPYRPLAEDALWWQANSVAEDGSIGFGGGSDARPTASIILFLTSEPAVYPPAAATQAARPGVPLAASHPTIER